MSSYDILFLSPSKSYISYNNAYGHECLAAYLNQESGIASRVYSGHIEDTYRIARREIENGNVRIVGFYAVQDTVTVVRHMSRWLRGMGVTVIVGGPQAAALTEEEIRRDYDYVLVGEGEISLNLLMNYLIGSGKSGREGDLTGFLAVCDSPEKIRGLKYADGSGAVRDNGPAECLENLDMKTFFNPEWNLNKKTAYGPGLFMMTGRGCPFHCAFCYEGTVRSVRLRSVENVLAEIDWHRKLNPGIVFVTFGDDTFSLNTERVKAIGEGLKARGLKFVCEAHVGMLYKHPEMIRIMAECGMTGTQLGIESGDPEVLKAYGKQSTPEMIEKVVKDLYDAGVVTVEGNVILGGAFETRESLEHSTAMTLRLMEAAPLVIDVTSLYYAPYPFTPMTTRPQDFDMEILPRPFDYTLHTMRCCVNRTKALTRNEIQEYRARHDEQVRKKYIEILSRMTFTELDRYLDHFPKHEMPDTMWRHYCKEIEHVWLFLSNGFRYVNMFDQDAVPTRTFRDLKYDGDALVVADYRLTGNERRLLELAGGAFTFRELESRLGLTGREIREIYNALHEKLLIYTERF